MRRLLVLAVVVLLATPLAGATAGAAPAGQAQNANAALVERGQSADAALAGPAPTADSVIVERVTFDRTPDRAGSVRVNVTYDLPDSVVSFAADSRYLRSDAVTLAASTGFDRASDGSFEWDERTARPTLSFRVAVTGTYTSDAVGVEGDDWAFVSLPNPYVSWRYRGTEPSFETVASTAGDGYASAGYALDGAANLTTRPVGDVNLTVVVAPTAEPAATVDAYARLYRVGIRELDPGFAYDASGVFVLPADRVGEDRPLGTSTRYSFWVQDEYSALDGVENTPAHEFVHTRLGSFGDGTSRWLTEASAEYYGHVLAMNDGYGSWSEFREAVTVERESFRDATLADPSTWSDPLVPYEKGALVLAALDAEIRERTGGVRSLEDVFAYKFSDDDPYGDLETYENFSAAVVAATNDESMRDWLDRYVRGDETPPAPTDPDAFVLNASMDSDDDGVPNGEEVRTNPFDADTDDDGYDDAEDPSPVDASRPTDTTTTTADEGTTATAPTTAGSGSDPATTASDAVSTTASGDGTGGVDGDAVPGFGVAVAALAVVLAALAVATGDRR